MATSEYVCVICATAIEDGYMYGAGDGSGQQFAHPLCYVKRDNKRLTALVSKQAREIARLREALTGMLESYELCMGSELAFSAWTKDILRGVFINEPERARAALAAASEEK